MQTTEDIAKAQRRLLMRTVRRIAKEAGVEVKGRFFSCPGSSHHCDTEMINTLRILLERAND